tara:strand:- start:376 stop:567 length:192 start_codon:yes stop_codon:yes gene_type:complete
MEIEKANWYDHKPSRGDDNKGYIYGIYYIKDDDVQEVEWFKSKAKRDKDFNVCIKLGYKSLIN